MHRSSFWSLSVLAVVSFSAPALAQTWVEDSFEDFADGKLDASGQNLYVSRDGTIRSIHRYDLNDDGWIDLLFNGTHDLIGILPSTLASVAADRSMDHSELAVEGARGVAIADLNRDGWNDVVFCPNRQGIQHPRRFVTLIYGGTDGWPASRSNGILPVHDATRVAIVDLDADDWLDIAVLNGTAWLPGQPDGRIVRVFWGSEQGFLLSSFADFGIPPALDLCGGDFDGDGAADLAVLCSDGLVRIIQSKPGQREMEGRDSETAALTGMTGTRLTAGDWDGDGRTDLAVATSTDSVYLLPNRSDKPWADGKVLTGFQADDITIGDMDGDGHPDLVLTRGGIAHAAGGEAIGVEKGLTGQVRILFGTGDDFPPDQALDLIVPYATSTAIGDLDADGRPDLAVAVYQSAAGTFATNAALLFGKGDRSFDGPLEGPPVSGATAVAIAPPRRELPARMVFANSQGGHVDEYADLLLYWNGRKGFSPENCLRIPFASGYEASAADLNADGFTDLVELCSGHAGGAVAEAMSQLGVNIFWGRSTGFDLKQPTVLREWHLYASNIADLDKDGYLDLVVGAFAPPPSEQQHLLIIYYGTPSGFSQERRTAIPSPGRSSICAIADFNRDTWLDIAVTSYEKDCVRIFWGGAEGFAEDRQKQLAFPTPIELETADLDQDGWLDLIVGSYMDPIAKHHDTGLVIFWGSPDGFREWNAQRLPALTPIGFTVADWDADGFLDLFSPHYHGELTREQLPCYLYWGGPDGFGTRNRTVLVCDSPSDSMAADFDRDGRLDLAVTCHSIDGNHACESQVFYNDGNRFAAPPTTSLPTVGAHWSWIEDMGHIYNRSWTQTYTSSVFQPDPGASRGTIKCEADVPRGAGISTQIRSAPTADGLKGLPWREAKRGRFSLAPEDRVLQYRIVFHSDNGDRYPILDRVTLKTLK